MKRYPILNAQELEFCKRVAGGETAYKVCMALGSKSKGAATFRTTQLMKKPQIKAAIERIQNEALATLGKKQGEAQAITVEFLDEHLVRHIEIGEANVAALLRLGYERAGILGKGAEEGSRAGAIKYPDGRMEVYQSKWLRDNGSSSEQPAGGEPVVAQD